MCDYNRKIISSITLEILEWYEISLKKIHAKFWRFRLVLKISIYF